MQVWEYILGTCYTEIEIESSNLRCMEMRARLVPKGGKCFHVTGRWYKFVLQDIDMQVG